MKTNHPLAIAITGATGRMGRMLIEAIINAPDCKLAAALVPEGDNAIGQDAGAFLGLETGIAIQSNLENALQVSDVLIDFTRPRGTLEHLQICSKVGMPAVIGTTGFTAEQKATIASLSQKIPIVMSPNMSVGVNVVLRLLDMAARACQTGYDIEIVEAHHRHKVDAPSGTALRMGEVIAQALKRDLSECAIYGREGYTDEREPSTIGFSTIRGGDVVGDHTVMFMGTGERIEISHKSSSRATYAEGSLRAAHFLMQQNSGLFDMSDVLGFNNSGAQ